MPIYMGVFEKPNVLDRNFRGGVNAKGFEGWIELQSAQFATGRSVTSPTGSSGRDASRPSIQEITVTKAMDIASNALYTEALTGKGRLIVIAFVKDGNAYLTLVLQNTMVSSYNLSGHGGSGSDQPMESLSL